jgi:amidohydrolase
LAAVRVPGARAGVDEELADVESRVLAWRRDLHRHPELSNRELRTAKLVGDHLRRLGLEVQTGIAHTGVAGFLKSGQPGPTIALRADMDALPVVERTGVPFRSTATANYLGDEVGVMHACGHDAHVAVLLGVAEVLAGSRAQWRGNGSDASTAPANHSPLFHLDERALPLATRACTQLALDYLTR